MSRLQYLIRIHLVAVILGWCLVVAAHADRTFNGVTVSATGNNADYFAGEGRLILSGTGLASGVPALIFDTNGYDVTIANEAVVARGPNGTTTLFLKKIGTGTLTLSGSSDFGTSASVYTDMGTMVISGSMQNGSFHIATDAANSASLIVSGVVESTSNFYVGLSGNGSLFVTGSGSNGSTLQIAATRNDRTGTMVISDHGYWRYNYVNVGQRGQGSLTIMDSGSMSGSQVSIGTYDGAVGLLRVTGHGLLLVDQGDASTYFGVGYGSSGTLQIDGNGMVKNLVSGAVVGDRETSDGSVIISGSGLWQNNGEIALGFNGRASLVVDGDGVVEGTWGVIGSGSTGVGSAIIDGRGVWRSGDLLMVGDDGSGRLELRGQGQVYAGELLLGAGNGDGVLVIGGTGVRITGSDGNGLAAVVGGTNNGSAKVIFDQGGEMTFSNAISGANLSVEARSGVTVFDTVKDYHGNTVIQSGALLRGGVQDVIVDSNTLVINPDGAFAMGGFDQRLQNLTNNGTVDFGQLGKRLTVTGNLGGNGNFRINTDIAGGIADAIEIEGASSGDHHLIIVNSGNAPSGKEAPLLLVQTADGIATFSGSASAGMFDYTVRNGGDINLSANNWYLWLSGSNPIISSEGDAILNSAAAIRSFWFTQQDNLLKRMGELRLNSEERRVKSESLVENIWVRSYGQQVNLNTGISGVKGFSETQYGVDLGTDKAWLVDDNNTLYTGVFAGYGGVDRDFHSGYNGGTDSGYGGLYGTWINKEGWYADTIVKGQYFDTSFDGEDHGSYNSYGVGLSLELGRQFQFAGGWFAEPSVQVSYLHLINDNYTTTQGMAVDLDDADIVQFYGGARFGRNIKLNEKGWLQPYVKVGGIEQISSGGKVRASGGEWRPTTDGGRGVIGTGIVYQLDTRNQLHLDYEASLGDKYDKPWGLNFGYRHQF